MKKYSLAIAFTVFALTFFVHAAHAAAMTFTLSNVGFEKVGTSYKIKGTLLVGNDNQTPVQGIHVIVRKANDLSTVQDKALTVAYTPGTAATFETNPSLAVGDYVVNVKKGNVESEAENVTIAETQPTAQDAAFSTAFSNVTLTSGATADAKYTLKGAAVVSHGSTGGTFNINNYFSKAYLLLTSGNNVTDEVTLPGGPYAFGQSIPFTVLVAQSPTYTYQLEILYGTKKVVVSNGEVAQLAQGVVAGAGANDSSPPASPDNNGANDTPPITDTLTNSSGAPKTLLENPLKVDSIQELVAEILKVLLIIAIPVIGIFIVLAGFRYVVARGKPDELEVAHRNILFVIVGAGLIIGCVLIVDIITITINDIKADVKTQ